MNLCYTLFKKWGHTSVELPVLYKQKVTNGKLIICADRTERGNRCHSSYQTKKKVISNYISHDFQLHNGCVWIIPGIVCDIYTSQYQNFLRHVGKVSLRPTIIFSSTSSDSTKSRRRSSVGVIPPPSPGLEPLPGPLASSPCQDGQNPRPGTEKVGRPSTLLSLHFHRPHAAFATH